MIYNASAPRGTGRNLLSGTKWLRWAVYLSLAALTIPASAQQTARITGIVLDESGEAVPGSTIAVNQTGAQDTVHALTDKNGNFSIMNLKAGGKYDVLVKSLATGISSREHSR